MALAVLLAAASGLTHGSLRPLPSAARAPRPVALLDSGSASRSRRQLTAKGRRTEIDGAPAGEGGRVAALRRDLWASSLPRPPAAVLAAIEKAFYATYDEAEINALWAQALSCYGDEERAIAAVERLPKLLNPTYTWPPPVMGRSKAALVEVLGSEADALEVMDKNPAILQCGAPGILELGADEIQLFATVLDVTSRTPPTVAAGLGIGLVLLVVGTIAGVRGGVEDAPLLQVSKVFLGVVFALAIEGSRVVIVGSIVAGQRRKRGAAEAEAEERRKQRNAAQREKRNAQGGWAKLGLQLADSVTSGVRK